MSTQHTTAVGRLVWGNPFTARDVKDGQGKVVNGQDGKPLQEYSFGLSIPKSECAAIFAVMGAEAAAACPGGIPANFAWKYKDGDTNDANGKPYSAREGYAMCAVFSFNTRFPVPVFQRQGSGLVQLTQGVKTGDFVRVAVTIDGHGAKPGVMGSKAGLYLNPTMVELVGYGEAILRGADPDDVFATPAALPAGASATPVASGPMAAPQAPQAAPQPPGFPPQAPAAAPTAPAAPPQPHATFPNGPQPGQPSAAPGGGFPWDKK